MQAIHTVRIRHSISRLRGINPTYVTLTVATAIVWLRYGIQRDLTASVFNSCIAFVAGLVIFSVLALRRLLRNRDIMTMVIVYAGAAIISSILPVMWVGIFGTVLGCGFFLPQIIHMYRLRADRQALRGFGWVPICMVIVFNIIWGSYAWVYHDTILEVQSVILICYGFIMAGIKLFASYLTSVVETSPVR